MDAPWYRRRPDRGTPRGPSRFRLEVTTLEDRQLPAVASVTVVVTPKILTPNHGEFLPVTISGKVEQIVQTNLPRTILSEIDPEQLASYTAINDSQPGPNQLLGLFTDQYRQVEPRVSTEVNPIPTSDTTTFRPALSFGKAVVVPAAVITTRDYTYSFTVQLQAKAASIGRQYAITVFANDFQAGVETTAFAFVPFKTVVRRALVPRR